jgi:hypothetical protein
MQGVIKYAGVGCDMYGDGGDLKSALAVLAGVAALVAWFAIMLIVFGSLPDRAQPIEITLLCSGGLWSLPVDAGG